MENTISQAKRWVFLLLAAMLLSPAMLLAQQRTISGTVTNASTAEPLIGALVVVDGTSNAAVTDVDGTFSFGNVRVGSTLSVTHLNYVSRTVVVGEAVFYDIKMETDTQIIDDVVVIGFGTQTKGNLTGAYGVATADEMKDRPVTFASQMLQGLVPGLNITQNSGDLGSRPSINVRGRGGVGTNNRAGDGESNPIILIDGIEGDINVINPADIDNITVLKDAAASSIYGSKAAFGVIIVTTKKGSQGNTRVNYSNNFRWSSPIVLPEQPNSLIFAAYFNDAATNNNGTVHFNDTWMQAMKDYQAGKFEGTEYQYGSSPNGSIWEEGFDPRGEDPNGTSTKVGGFANNDWYKKLFRKSSFAQEHNLSLSGAKDRFNYYTSFNYVDQKGLMRFNQDGYDRYSVNARVGYQILKWIDFTYNVRYNKDIYDRASGNYNYDNVGRQTWPMLAMYDGNGNLFGRLAKEAEYNGDRVEKTDNLTQRAQFVFEPVKSWKTTLEMAYSTRTNNVHTEDFNVPNWGVDGNLIAPTGGSSSIREDITMRSQYTMNLFSEYSFKVKEDHNFKVMAGTQWVSEEQKAFGIQKYGVIMEDLPEIGLTTDQGNNGSTTAPVLQNWADDNNRERNYRTAVIGVFGRVNYNYKNRYLLEANLRFDESSRFRAGHRGTWAPSFSAGWNLARENFMESARSLFSMLKLRASYGTIANQSTRGFYPTYSNLSLGSNSGNWWQDGKRGNTAANPNILESPYMMWSRIVSVDIGLDFAILNDRLTGGFDWFNRRNTDQLGDPIRLPAVLGVSAPVENNLETKDVGFELSLGWKDKLRNGFSYGVRFMLSDYQTTVIKYPGNPTLSISSEIPGQKVGNIWGYVTKGVAQTDKEMNDYLETVKQTYIASSGWGGGDIMYVDLNGDGEINQGQNTLSDHGDRKVIGNSTPRYVFSLDLTADWKGFDFRAFFQGVGKRDFAPGGTFFWGATGGGNGGLWWANCFETNLDYWRNEDTWSVKNGYMKENTDDPYFARAKFGNHNTQTQTRYLQDASYIRLKNLQIGYTLPSKWTDRIKMDRVRIFVSAENLLTYSPIYGLFDPETAYGNGGGNMRGNAYPLSRTLSFGANINF